MPTPGKKRPKTKIAQTVLNAKIARLPRPVRIKRHKFALIKNDEDFLAMVKVGRLVNVISFGMRIVQDYSQDYSPVGRRQSIRAMFIIGGYLYEGLALLESLRARYHKESFFASLENLRSSKKYDFERKVLKEMRHNAAFHLDSDNKSTRAALTKLKLPQYDLMSGNNATMGDFYFNFSDIVDFNYIIDILKGNQTEPETVNRINRTLSQLMPEFLAAGHVCSLQHLRPAVRQAHG